MKPVPIFLLCLACSWRVQCAESPFPPDAALLAHWIAGQQYSKAGLPSQGGLRIGNGVAATAIDGTPYYRVSPYTIFSLRLHYFGDAGKKGTCRNDTT